MPTMSRVYGSVRRLDVDKLCSPLLLSTNAFDLFYASLDRFLVYSKGLTICPPPHANCPPLYYLYALPEPKTSTAAMCARDVWHVSTIRSLRL